MPEHALWNLSRAFHEAITQKRPDLLNEHLDENIDWAVYGPIDMFPFLGARTGRTGGRRPGGEDRTAGADAQPVAGRRWCALDARGPPATGLPRG